jgi:protoheme IX farnesyltransferase
MICQGAFFSLIDRMQPYLQLVKVPICLMVAFSAFLGAVMAGRASLFSAMIVSLGLLFLAMGCAALNSWQEMAFDSLLRRTRNRPLPRGRIFPDRAVQAALLLILTGLTLLSRSSQPLLTVEISLAAVTLYNLVYTPLKTRTMAAIIPGAVSGALPPYIGWIAAGGAPLSRSALLMVLLFMVWQIPHSLLVMLMHKDDYLDNDIPSLVTLFPESSLRRICFVWVGAFMVILLSWVEFLSGATHQARILLLLSVCAAFLLFCLQLSGRWKSEYHSIFMQFNCYLLLIMTILTGDRLFFG